MPSSDADPWRQRARPCFGSLLAIKTRGLAYETANLAVSAAFAEAERLHALMSRQSPESDLSAIARLLPGESVRIARDTHAVLGFALRMAEDTNGLFNLVAPNADGRAGDWRDLCVAANGSVRVRRQLQLSLDGVAKGWAADFLCRYLRDRGASDVVIDAGGDLALACAAAQTIELRDPERPGIMTRSVIVASGGVASSAVYGGMSELWSAKGRSKTWPRAVTIVAPDCATADALTKVMALEPSAQHILARWNAHAALSAPAEAR